jgi:type IV pilus assembly protein PilV
LRHKVVVSANNTVTLTLCWQTPQDEAPHNFSMTTQIRG